MRKIKVTSFKFLLSLILLLSLSITLISCTSDNKQSKDKQDNSSENKKIEEDSTELTTNNESSEKPSPELEAKVSSTKNAKNTNKTAKEADSSEAKVDSEVESYRKAVKEFEEVSIKDLREAASRASKDEVFYAYLGSESCPFCTLLAPVLAEIKEEHNLRILYIDSDKNGSDDDLIDDFWEFIEEKDLSTIPVLFIIKNQEIQQIKVKHPYSVEKLSKLMGLTK